MGLRAQAASDLIEIMHDESSGDTCMIISPSGEEVEFDCLSSDIHLAVDPGTGEIVTGRQVHVSVLISDLVLSGFESINGEPDSSKRPWRFSNHVSEDDGGYTFKVVESHPDRTLGFMFIVGEKYESQ